MFSVLNAAKSESANCNSKSGIAEYRLLVVLRAHSISKCPLLLEVLLLTHSKLGSYQTIGILESSHCKNGKLVVRLKLTQLAPEPSSVCEWTIMLLPVFLNVGCSYVSTFLFLFMSVKVWLLIILCIKTNAVLMQR